MDGASLHINRFVTCANNALIVVGQIRRPSDPRHESLLRLDAQCQLDPTAFRSCTCSVNTWRPSPDASHCQGIIIDLTANGLLDPDFNGGQPLITPITPNYEVQWLDIQALVDGRFLLAGHSRNRVSSFNIYVYLADGRPGTGFGIRRNGSVDTPTGGNNDAPLQMARQPDGNLLASLNTGAFRKGTLLRYLS